MTARLDNALMSSGAAYHHQLMRRPAMIKNMAGALYEHSSSEMLMGGQPADIINDARRRRRPDAVDSDGDDQQDVGDDASKDPDTDSARSWSIKRSSAWPDSASSPDASLVRKSAHHHYFLSRSGARPSGSFPTFGTHKITYNRIYYFNSRHKITYDRIYYFNSRPRYFTSKRQLVSYIKQ